MPRCASSRISRGSTRALKALDVHDDAAHVDARERRNARSGSGGRRGRRAFVGARADRLEDDPARLSADGRGRELQGEKPHGETAYQWFRDGEIIALLPLPDGHVSLVWSARTEHADALLALDPAQLAAEVETRDAEPCSARSTA